MMISRLFSQLIDCSFGLRFPTLLPILPVFQQLLRCQHFILCMNLCMNSTKSYKEFGALNICTAVPKLVYAFLPSIQHICLRWILWIWPEYTAVAAIQPTFFVYTALVDTMDLARVRRCRRSVVRDFTVTAPQPTVF